MKPLTKPSSLEDELLIEFSFVTHAIPPRIGIGEDLMSNFERGKFLISKLNASKPGQIKNLFTEDYDKYDVNIIFVEITALRIQ